MTVAIDGAGGINSIGKHDFDPVFFYYYFIWAIRVFLPAKSGLVTFFFQIKR
jgi:hypothetical protein